MRMFLMHDGEAAAKLEAEIGPMAFIVKEAEAADPSLLPLGVRIPMQVCSGLELKTAIARWLSNRQAREETCGLEGGGPVAGPVMGRAYWAGAGGLGRIRQPGHAVAALSYYLSGADRYYLTPETEEAVCCVPQDGGNQAVYPFKPCTEEMAEAIQKGEARRDKGGPDGFVPDIRYTVPSSTASWWEWKGRWKCLAQKPDEQGLAVYRDILRKRFPSRKDAWVVRFDFSHVKDDVLWLSDLAPYLKPGRDAWGQAEKLLREFPRSRKALEDLEACAGAAEGYGVQVAWGKMGISCGEYEAEAVVIL